MSNDRIEPTFSSIDIDDDAIDKKNIDFSDATNTSADASSDSETNKIDSAIETHTNSVLDDEPESDLEKELASLGEELKSFDFSNDDPVNPKETEDDFEIMPMSMAAPKGEIEPEVESIVTPGQDEKSKDEKSNKKKSKIGKSKPKKIFDNIKSNFVSKRQKEPEPKSEAEQLNSQYEYRSNQQTENKHNQYTQHFRSNNHSSRLNTWLGFSSRLDRVRAATLLLASAYLAAAIISFADPSIKWIMGIFGSAGANSNDFALNPVSYFIISLVVWLSSVLLITIRRLKDVNRSPFLCLLLFLPPISLLVINYCTKPSYQDHCQYGPEPEPYSYKDWIVVALFAILIPLFIITYLEVFKSYFWTLQNNLSVIPKAS